MTRFSDEVMRPVPLGDLDCSGKVEFVDALAVLRFLVNIQRAPLCIDAGDVKCDGDIDSVDALQILRFLAGLGTVQEPGCPDRDTGGIGSSK